MKYAVEFEGFSLGKRFIFKELTLRSFDLSIHKHFFIKAPVIKSVALYYQRTIRYCETNLHKIRWNSGNVYLKDVKTSLAEILKPEDIVYIRGSAKVAFLKNQLNVPCNVVDVSLYSPSARVWRSFLETILDKEHCPLGFHRRNIHCSGLKTLAIIRFLEEEDFQNE